MWLKEVGRFLAGTFAVNGKRKEGKKKKKNYQSHPKLDLIEILASIAESTSGRSINSAYCSKSREKQVKVFNEVW